jgi:hypothetical protein
MASAIKVNASGQEMRPEIADFDIERWALVLAKALIEHGHEQEELAEFTLKNYRPPRPIGVKGGCSPQNNRKKLRAY